MRNRRIRLLPPSVLAAFAVLACGDAVEINAISENAAFGATLAGANERPTPVTTTLTGSALFSVVQDTFLLWRVDLQYPDTAQIRVWGAHIHVLPPGAETGGIVLSMLNITPTSSGRALRQFTGQLTAGQIKGSATAPTLTISFDSLLTLMRNGNAYVNVHTTRNNAGEIRGPVQVQ